MYPNTFEGDEIIEILTQDNHLTNIKDILEGVVDHSASRIEQSIIHKPHSFTSPNSFRDMSIYYRISAKETPFAPAAHSLPDRIVQCNSIYSICQLPQSSDSQKTIQMDLSPIVQFSQLSNPQQLEICPSLEPKYLPLKPSDALQYQNFTPTEQSLSFLKSSNEQTSKSTFDLYERPPLELFTPQNNSGSVMPPISTIFNNFCIRNCKTPPINIVKNTEIVSPLIKQGIFQSQKDINFPFSSQNYQSYTAPIIPQQVILTEERMNSQFLIKPELSLAIPPVIQEKDSLIEEKAEIIGRYSKNNNSEAYNQEEDHQSVRDPYLFQPIHQNQVLNKNEEIQFTISDKNSPNSSPSKQFQIKTTIDVYPKEYIPCEYVYQNKNRIETHISSDLSMAYSSSVSPQRGIQDYIGEEGTQEVGTYESNSNQRENIERSEIYQNKMNLNQSLGDIQQKQMLDDILNKYRKFAKQNSDIHNLSPGERSRTLERVVSKCQHELALSRSPSSTSKHFQDIPFETTIQNINFPQVYLTKGQRESIVSISNKYPAQDHVDRIQNNGLEKYTPLVQILEYPSQVKRTNRNIQDMSKISLRDQFNAQRNTDRVQVMTEPQSPKKLEITRDLLEKQSCEVQFQLEEQSQILWNNTPIQKRKRYFEELNATKDTLKGISINTIGKISENNNETDQLFGSISYQKQEQQTESGVNQVKFRSDSVQIDFENIEKSILPNMVSITPSMVTIQPSVVSIQPSMVLLEPTLKDSASHMIPSSQRSGSFDAISKGGFPLFSSPCETKKQCPTLFEQIYNKILESEEISSSHPRKQLQSNQSNSNQHANIKNLPIKQSFPFILNNNITKQYSLKNILSKESSVSNGSPKKQSRVIGNVLLSNQNGLFTQSSKSNETNNGRIQGIGPPFKVTKGCFSSQIVPQIKNNIQTNEKIKTLTSKSPSIFTQAPITSFKNYNYKIHRKREQICSPPPSCKTLDSKKGSRSLQNFKHNDKHKSFICTPKSLDQRSCKNQIKSSKHNTGDKSDNMNKLSTKVILKEMDFMKFNKQRVPYMMKRKVNDRYLLFKKAVEYSLESMLLFSKPNFCSIQNIDNFYQSSLQNIYEKNKVSSDFASINNRHKYFPSYMP